MKKQLLMTTIINLSCVGTILSDTVKKNWQRDTIERLRREGSADSAIARTLKRIVCYQCGLNRLEDIDRMTDYQMQNHGTWFSLHSLQASDCEAQLKIVREEFNYGPNTSPYYTPTQSPAPQASANDARERKNLIMSLSKSDAVGNGCIKEWYLLNPKELEKISFTDAEKYGLIDQYYIINSHIEKPVKYMKSEKEASDYGKLYEYRQSVQARR